MTADALSDVLKMVRLTGATFFDVAARAPWVAESPRPDLVLPKILSGAEHLIAYHVLVEGRCFANIVGHEPIALEAGEVIVFTRCDPHVLASSPGMRSEPPGADAIAAATSAQLPFRIQLGHEGAIAAKLVCGYLACDAQPYNPLLDNLPPVITVRDEDDATPWLSQFIRLASTESTDKRAGGESVLAKLSELMFIEVVRRYLAGMPDEQSGWLAGLRDPFVGKALALLHAQPELDWTIEKLGKDVGLSRSVLAERFADLVGVPPMQYLAKWRMQIAAGLLNSGNTNIATIAATIGYASEAAFSRAFKKTVGVSPSDWRRRK